MPSCFMPGCSCSYCGYCGQLYAQCNCPHCPECNANLRSDMAYKDCCKAQLVEKVLGGEKETDDR